MPNPDPVRRHQPLLYAAALLFAVLTVLYSVAWMYYVRGPQPQVEIGIEEKYSPAGVEIAEVHNGTPAEAAGLRANDRVVAINGSTADSAGEWTGLLYRTWLRSRPGDTVTLTVQRPGQSQPLVITPAFRAKQGAGDTRTAARTVAMQILSAYPIFFAVVGLAVLFLRVEDRNAWLLALVFATFITAADMPSQFAAAPPHLQSFLLAYRSLGNAVLAELFYFFFAVFPTRSPIDRKVPWLKWVLLVMGLCLGLGGYREGFSVALPIFAPVLSYRAAQNARIVVAYGSAFLGLISLLCNMFSVSSRDDRRKLKVIFWGTVVGVTPALVIALMQDVFHIGFSFWLNFAKVILLFLFPLSFAYAVVKHRVMDIPVLLKRSARYFVVERGFVISYSGDFCRPYTLVRAGIRSSFLRGFEGHNSHWRYLRRADDHGRHPDPSSRSYAPGPRVLSQLLRRTANPGEPGGEDPERQQPRRAGFASPAEHRRRIAPAFDVRLPAGQQRTARRVRWKSAAGSDDTLQHGAGDCGPDGA